MPKFTKCWYKDCDSDNRVDPNLLFYKFPKEFARCQQWVTNCANTELSDIWRSNPEKVACLRICQKHFLEAFLSASSRLVGHAVPAPYGVSLDQIDAEKFMVDCAIRKSLAPTRLNSSSNNNNLLQESEITAQQSHNNTQQPQSLPSPNTASHLTTVNLTDNQLMTTNATTEEEDHQSHFYDTTLVDNQDIPYEIFDDDSCLVEHSIVIDQSQCQQSETAPPAAIPLNESHVSNLKQIKSANPKIIYDKNGKLVSLEYLTETISLVDSSEREQQEVHVIALKQKVLHYQRKLAVLNHRYQKLRSQVKGRSKKSRLLEALKLCQAEFNPLVFEIFKRQIKRSRSRHGNRWSKDVKAFSSSIYLRSRSAYKFLRKTVDLPSESIIKRHVRDNKNSTALNVTSDSQDVSEIDDEDDEEDVDDEEDYEGGEASEEENE